MTSRSCGHHYIRRSGTTAEGASWRPIPAENSATKRGAKSVKQVDILKTVVSGAREVGSKVDLSFEASLSVLLLDGEIDGYKLMRTRKVIWVINAHEARIDLTSVLHDHSGGLNGDTRKFLSVGTIRPLDGRWWRLTSHQISTPVL